MQKKVGIVVAAALLATPVVAQAQGLVGGAERGAAEGDRAAGPIGGIVGGAVGAAAGTVGGILGVDERPRFREYVVREHHPSFHYDEAVRTGVVLPERGIEYYPVPAEYHLRPTYRYTIINDEPVIVDPVTRRVVEVLD